MPRRPLVALMLSLLTLTVACVPWRTASPEVERPPGAEGRALATPPPLTLRFSHGEAKHTPKHRAAERFAELAQQKSGGKIEVQVFADAELYGEGDEIPALQRGALHFIAPSSDRLAAIAPAWEATALPFIFSDQAAVDRFVDPENATTEELLEQLRAEGLLGLTVWENGFKHFTNSRRQLVKPTDFESLAFRAASEPERALVRAFGGEALITPSSELFDALQQGLVDGQYDTWSNVVNHGYHEVQQYGTISRGGALLSYGVVTNAQWWDNLDPVTREILRTALREASAYASKIAEAENVRALQHVRASGQMELHEQTKEEAQVWLQAASQVHEQWESRTGAEIIDELKALNES